MISANRLIHMNGVAKYMHSHASEYGLDKDKMFLLGYLHDIGYYQEKEDHDKSGADLVEKIDMGTAKSIRYHSMTPYEYMAAHNCKESDIPKELILLWEADMSIGSNGKNVGFTKRLQSIGDRYGTDSIVYKKCEEKIEWLIAHINEIKAEVMNVDIKSSIDCNNCNASQYGGYTNNVQEYCLKHDKDLETVDGRTVPCRECNGKDFIPDTW